MAIIRPATPADLPQVRAISTYYILNTALIFTQTSPPPAVFQAKYDDLKSRGLPYVVAVDEELTNAEDGADLVLGYAYLSPFRSHMLSYAATVELSLFVHPDHQSRSLGSRLLAAVLEAAPAVRHRAYEVTGSDEEPRKVFAGEKGESEGGLPLRNILAVMAVSSEGLDGGDALRRWYIKRGFVERGRMEKIGFKRGEWIDTIYLQYTLA